MEILKDAEKKEKKAQKKQEKKEKKAQKKQEKKEKKEKKRSSHAGLPPSISLCPLRCMRSMISPVSSHTRAVGE